MNIAKHRNILIQILKDIASDASLSPILGFKGGTAALLFYGLDRFSVDLDFDLLDSTKADQVLEKINRIAKKYGDVKESRKKRFNLVTVISYELGAQKIKIEINTRSFGSKYEVKTFR